MNKIVGTKDAFTLECRESLGFAGRISIPDRQSTTETEIRIKRLHSANIHSLLQSKYLIAEILPFELNIDFHLAIRSRKLCSIVILTIQ